MIIWRGLGFLVAVIVFLASLGANLLTDYVAGDSYWKENGWPFASSLLVSAVLCWCIGIGLERGSRRSEADPAFAAKIGLPLKNELFFIPMKWWAAILGLIAVALLVSGGSPESW